MTRDESLERELKDALRARVATPCPGEDALLAFYRGALAETENESLREHLATCAPCVELARDARAFLEAWEGAPEESRASGVRWLAAAAVVGAALLAGLWVARSRPEASRPEVPPTSASAPANPWRDLPVAAAEYRPVAPEDELLFRSEEGTRDDGFAAAMTPYGRGDYAGADVGLARFLATHPDHAAAAFYRGVSLLLLGKPAEARPLLASAATARRAPAEARWYLALALLKSGDTREALGELDAVAVAFGPHREEAAKLATEVRSAVGPR